MYLQPAPLFGGAERQAATLASLLPEYGVEVLPVVGPGRAIVSWLSERGVTRIVHSMDFPGGWPKQIGWRRLTLPWRYVQCGLRARQAISALVEQQAIDIIVASLPFAWIVGTLAARRAGIPVVWRAGGARINLVQRLAVWVLTRILRPDLLLCNGEAVRRCFGPLVPARALVVPNGVDTEIFRRATANRSRYRPAGARWVVGFAGRLVASKRPQDLIALGRRLARRLPEARILIGGEGSLRRRYERLARKAGVANIEFIGFVEDMPSFLAACDVAVLASDGEGCSNFVLEAMAMGTPVVAAGVPPVLEVVEHAQNGLIFPVGDVERLAEWVTLLLEQPEMRTLLALRARATADRLNARRAAASLSQALRTLVAEHAATRCRAPEAPLPESATAPPLALPVLPGMPSPRIRPTSRSHTD
jgi:glycosyltransferase involved in cell wall biosynthesis